MLFVLGNTFQDPPRLQEAKDKSRPTQRVKETTIKVKYGNRVRFSSLAPLCREKREFVSRLFSIIPIIPQLIAN